MNPKNSWSNVPKVHKANCNKVVPTFVHFLSNLAYNTFSHQTKTSIHPLLPLATSESEADAGTMVEVVAEGGGVGDRRRGFSRKDGLDSLGALDTGPISYWEKTKSPPLHNR